MRDNNKTLIQPLNKWTNHHSKAGTWKAYMHNNGTVYTKNEDNIKLSQYRKAGTQLHLIEDDLTAIPMSDCTPTTVNTLSNNKKYCNMTATIEASQAEQTQLQNTWEALVQAQPEWVQILLSSVNFESLEEIRDMLKSHGFLIAVSDGSGKDFAMTFGWVICTPNKWRLATAAGPCSGRVNSLRHEAAVMLSVSLFFALVKTYFELESVTVKFVSDNLELINRGNAHLSYDYPYPNTTLKSEFDLTKQIYRTHQAYNINSTFHHVKNHQDKTTKFKKLPLFAQLNIEADALAGLYQKEQGRYLPSVVLLPSCPAVLNIRVI